MNLICSIPNCGYLAEKNGICPRHNREARKSSAPKEKPKRQRIAKQSDNQKDRLAIYYSIRELYLKENCYCAAHFKVFPDVRSKEVATDVHHMAGREGDALYDVRRWLPVCRSCHSVITVESEWAYNEGLSLSRHAIETV